MTSGVNGSYIILVICYHLVMVGAPLFIGLIVSQNLKIAGDARVLSFMACVSGGLVLFDFWLAMISPVAGIFYSGLVILIAPFLIVKRFRDLTGALSVNALSYALLAWVFYASFVLFLGLCSNSSQDVLVSAASRFSHALPIDNQLPFILAKQVSSGHVNKPMIGEWLSSDRPPLQAAFFIFSLAQYFPDSELHYQVNSTLLQTLWVVPLVVVLARSGLEGVSIVLIVSTAMTAGFSLVNEYFTWPKMLPVFYLVLLTNFYFPLERFVLNAGDWVMVGVLAALSLLCHGSSLFLLIGLIILLSPKIRELPLKFVALSSLAFAVFYSPWMFYQRYIDPPGDRLLKWHMAGVVPVDARTFLDALGDSYSSISYIQIFENKVSNIKALFGNFSAWCVEMFQIVSGDSSIGLVSSFRASQFFSLIANLDFLIIPVMLSILMPLPGKSMAPVIAYDFLRLSLVTTLVWCLMLFGPGAAIVHVGSMANILFVYIGVWIIVFSRFRILSYFIALAHLFLMFQVYIAPVGLSKYPFDIGMYFLSLLFLIISIYFIFLSCKFFVRPEGMTNGN